MNVIVRRVLAAGAAAVVSASAAVVPVRTPSAAATVMASAEADGPSYSPSISPDGGFVAFISAASNLVPDDRNGAFDVFLRDVVCGVTRRMSVSSTGAEGNADGGDRPVVSVGGRFVAFSSRASNLVAGDTNSARDVFVRDTWRGRTMRASVGSEGLQGPDDVLGYSMSADGRFVAFVSHERLVPEDTADAWDFFVRDLWRGTTERVNVSSTGEQAEGTSYGLPALSADGRFVVFASSAANLVDGDTNGAFDVFVRDRWRRTTQLISRSNTGALGNQEAIGGAMAITPDGRFVVFSSAATNLVPDDTNGLVDVFVRDRWNGTTRRANVNTTGEQANSYTYNTVSISADGTRVGFISAATNLVPGRSLVDDVYLRDLARGTTERLTTNPAGRTGNGFSSGAGTQFISGDGNLVVFHSDSSDLIPAEANGAGGVFLRRRHERTTTRLSVGQ